MSGDKVHTPTFQRYIDQGHQAALTHPDYDQLDPYTTAKDVIGNLLHWSKRPGTKRTTSEHSRPTIYSTRRYAATTATRRTTPNEHRRT